ncbi:hypothetical protein AMECASPLE_013225 [Ameca splendens]|uniref:Uncharacterized protein n=1 Tax=Ameca splendens TaxID=208324 RepID=A0ABV1A7M3_9TELE
MSEDGKTQGKNRNQKKETSCVVPKGFSSVSSPMLQRQRSINQLPYHTEAQTTKKNLLKAKETDGALRVEDDSRPHKESKTVEEASGSSTVGRTSMTGFAPPGPLLTTEATRHAQEFIYQF